jgi:hypothetical protein
MPAPAPAPVPSPDAPPPDGAAQPGQDVNKNPDPFKPIE